MLPQKQISTDVMKAKFKLQVLFDHSSCISFLSLQKFSERQAPLASLHCRDKIIEGCSNSKQTHLNFIQVLNVISAEHYLSCLVLF